MEHRCGFPTANPAFQGVLPADPSRLRKELEGHDLVLVAGAAAFSYVAEADAGADEPGLPDGSEVVMLTSDPDQAARSPYGDAVIGDVGLALRWLVAAVPAAARPAPPPGAPPPPVEQEGLTLAAVHAAIAAARPADAVLVVESASGMRSFLEQVRFERPGSFYTGAGTSLGFALPAAIGIQLGSPDRRVLALVDEGAFQYGAPALWSAVHYGVPLTTVVLSNDGYGPLCANRDGLAPGAAPGADLPGLDHVALARGYGMPAQRIADPAELTQAVRLAIADRSPQLIEVPVTGPPAPHW